MSRQYQYPINLIKIVAIIAFLGALLIIEAQHAQSQSTEGKGKEAKIKKLFVAVQEAYEKEKYRRTIDLCTRIIRIAPSYAKALLFRGMSYEMLGKRQRAVQDYEKAIEVEPTSYQAMENLAGILEQEGKDVPRAIELYERALKLDTRPEWVGKLPVWISALKTRQREVESHAVLAWQAGNDHLRDGDTDLAEQCFSKAIRLRPTFHQAYFSRGNVALTKDDTASAIADYSLGLELSHVYPGGYLLRGKAWEKLGDKATAMKDFLRARDTDPYNPLARYSIGRMLMEGGLPGLALFNLERAMKLKPKPELRGLITKQLQLARPTIRGQDRGVLKFLGIGGSLW